MYGEAVIWEAPPVEHSSWTRHSTPYRVMIGTHAGLRMTGLRHTGQEMVPLGARMKNLSTTIATYQDQVAARRIGLPLNRRYAPARSTWLTLSWSSAAPTARSQPCTVSRTTGGARAPWPEGRWTAFPPPLVGGAVAGAAGGGVIARLIRSLDRGDIKDLGEVMDSGEIAMVVLIHEDSVKTLIDLLEGASKTLTKSSSTAEELQEVLECRDVPAH